MLESPGTTWKQICDNLRQGCRGLPGDFSLARLLAALRGVPNHAALPPIYEWQVLAWADAYHMRHGKWPNTASGQIEEAPDISWAALNNAMEQGSRGLPAGRSLARLLSEVRGLRNPARLPDLTDAQVLRWADAHYRRTRKWPTQHSGPVPGVPGETWMAIANACRFGRRGRPMGVSLPVFLQAARGRKIHANKSDLLREDIIHWADAHYQRAGAWPTLRSGQIPEADGLTWTAVNAALVHGLRGLDAGESLVELLAKHRGKRNPSALPALDVAAILEWARAHRQRTGNWPTQKSGPVFEAPGETWGGITNAFRTGARGLPVGKSLPELLDTIRARRQHGPKPRAANPDGSAGD